MIADSLRLLAISLKDLGVQIPEDLNAVTDPAATLTLLAVLREHRKELLLLEQYVERVAAVRMPKKVMEWPNGRATRHKTATKVEWDSERLASAVLVAAMVDENGELPSEESNAVACRVKEAFMKTVGIGYWRQGALTDMNIDPQDYKKSEPGRWVVEVELGEAAA